MQHGAEIGWLCPFLSQAPAGGLAHALCRFLSSLQMASRLQLLCPLQTLPALAFWLPSGGPRLAPHRHPQGPSFPRQGLGGRRGRSPNKWENRGPTARPGGSQVVRQKRLGKPKRLHDGGEPPGQETMFPRLWELTSCDRWLISTILSESETMFRPNILKCNRTLTYSLHSYDCGCSFQSTSAPITSLGLGRSQSRYHAHFTDE